MQEDKPFVWPQGLPPRVKLLLLGAASLSDQELLALFLRTGVSWPPETPDSRCILK